MPNSLWDKTKHGGKVGFDKVWTGFEKLGAPVNKLTNKIGSEAFWPTSLDKESDKAARILKSFCKDGFYTEQVQDAHATTTTGSPAVTGPKQKAKVLVKIPQKVIQNACGLAIFSTMRTGLWVSGSGGSGVLIARLPDGSWSPPSGILIHTVGVGFMAGIDIYDCVLVINSPKALEAFKKLRVTLGAEVSVAAGPVGIGGILDSNVDLRKERDHTPVFTYMKSRGLYAGVQVDGTFIIERNDENAKYYGERLGVNDILAGKVRHVPDSARPLIEIIRSAEGKTDVNRQFLNHVWEMPPPSEVDVEKNAEATHEQKTAYGPAYGSDVKYA